MTASLQQVLDRAILRTVAITCGAVIVIGLVVSFVAATKQDDDEAIANAHNLAQELDEAGHGAARAVLAKETAELALGSRHVAAFDGTESLVDSTYADRGSDGCTFDGTTRLCRASVSTFHVVVATPVARIGTLAAPVALAVFVTALLCAALLFTAGRRSARAAVTPMLRLEAKLRASEGLPRSDELTEAWGLTEVDSLASALRAALTRAEVATARETRFVADAAHELRTPLTRLRGQLELALEDPSLGADARERTVRAVANVNELVRLTEALLAMARGVLPQREPVDLSDTVDSVLRTLDEVERARVSVSRATDAIVAGEPALLELALRNLVVNALVHGDGAISIRVTLGDDVVVDVLDEGKGIAESELDRVKVAFVRGDETGKARGSGIGLALVEHVAALHQGALTLSNRTEGGLCASLRFPRWRAESR